MQTMATSKKPVKAKAAAPKAPARRTPAPKAVSKPALPSAAAPAAVPEASPAKPAKPKKPKLVRDSFTIPKPEYAVLADLKQRCAKLGAPAKKSELLRAGIKALATMSDAALAAALRSVPALKTGRPAKS
jgi:hypothetical protein